MFSPDDVRDRSLKAKRELDAAARSEKAKKMLDAAKAAKQRTMKEDTEHLGTVVALVANQDYSAATEMVQDILNQRVVGALDSYKKDVAQSLFTSGVSGLEEESK